MTSEPAFEGAEIGGKRFPFVRVTIARQIKIVKQFNPKLRDAFFPTRSNLRMWKRVRSVAFVKDWKWRYFHIIPKELRCSEILLQTAGELQASFFSYVGEAVKGHDLPLASVIPSKMVNEQQK